MSDNDKKNENIHKGHRIKVRNKFYESGFSGMASHNILEILLFFGIPYKDTNPIAHDLINRFGSLSAVLEAKRTDLMQIKGMTENAACLLTMILPLYRKYSEDLIARKRTFNSVKETADFLRTLYIDNNNNERVYVLCFDANNNLVTFRMLNEGDIRSSSVDLRKLASIILETNAASVVISHNHPHGVSLPSSEDIVVTKDIVSLLATLKVKLNDHIIVTDTDYFSMAGSTRFAHIFLNIENPYLKD